MEHENDGDTNSNWCARYGHQRFGARTGGLGNERTREAHSNDNIVKINWNTKKGPGDLRRLAVTQMLVEDLSKRWSEKHSME